MKSRFITSFGAVLITILIGLGIPAGVLAQDQGPADQPQVSDQPQDQAPASDQTEDQPPADNQPAQDQNQSSVARISFIHGDVSQQRGDTGDWSAASLNSPVVAGDAVSTGDNARTEVELDYADILRLDNHTQANIVNLSRSQIQVQLSQGEANYSVFKNGEADVEIDTPNVAVHPARADDSVRVEVVSNDETRVIVRKGSVDISTPQGSTHVESGEMITIRGAGNDTQYKIADAPGRDDWDSWNSDRDHTILNAHSWKNTNRYYTGSEDLDAYGQWRNVPDYGQVWVPQQASGWAPYSDGQWVWEPYWGWTWTSYEPWGWAPYHYGRWMYVDDAWGWWPGPVYGGFYRPIWAPAYVSFFGFGGGGFGFDVGFGWGSIGWLPIGPCDGFFPWWGGYRSQFNVVNVTNIYNIHNVRGGLPPLRTGTRFSNVYQATHNENFRRAISTVPANDFGRGRIRPTPVTRQQFTNARMVAGNLPVVPNRQSLSVSGRPAAASTLAHATQPAHFFSKARPSAGARPSFNQERARLTNAIQHSGQPAIGGREPVGVNTRAGMNNGRSTAGVSGRPAINAGGVSNSRGAMNNPPGVNRGGSPANTRRPAESNARTGSSNSEWQRFGVPRPPSAGNGAAVSGGSRGGQTNVNQPGRQVNNANGGARATGSQNNSGWQTFSRSSAGSSGRSQSASPAPMNRGSAGPAGRPAQEIAQNRGNNNGWQKFTPQRPPSSGAASSRGSNGAAPSRPIGSAPPRSSSPVWSERPPMPSRNSQPSRGYSRPPLNMRQPIVGPGSSPRYSSPRYSAPSNPRYSTPPSSGPRYSAPPSQRPAPSGPRYSAPPSPRYSAPPSAPRSYSPPSGGGYRGGPPSGGGFHGGAPSGGGYHGAPSGGAPRGSSGGGSRGGSSHGGRH